MKILASSVSVGARTSLGLTAVHTGFLLRAGCAGMSLAPLTDASGEPITACFLPTIDATLTGVARAEELAVGAMREALAPVAEVIEPLRIRMLLCVDEALAVTPPNGGQPPAAVLLSAVQAQAQAIAPALRGEVCARGAAGVGFALGEALESLGRTYDAVLLGGVHTDFDPAVIRALESAGRLHSGDHIDALIPGEAAAFVLLMHEELARRLGLQPLARIHAISGAFDKATPDNDASAFEAVGLTVALRKAGSPLVEASTKAGWILTDFTFERFRFYEWQSVTVRARQILGEPHQLDSPAQRLGYLGAAAMPLHLVLASEAWRRGYAPHPLAVSVAGSDAGERAAMVLSQAAR